MNIVIILFIILLIFSLIIFIGAYLINSVSNNQKPSNTQNPSNTQATTQTANNTNNDESDPECRFIKTDADLKSNNNYYIHEIPNSIWRVTFPKCGKYQNKYIKTYSYNYYLMNPIPTDSQDYTQWIKNQEVDSTNLIKNNNYSGIDFTKKVLLRDNLGFVNNMCNCYDQGMESIDKNNNLYCSLPDKPDQHMEICDGALT
jgi:hypothetical protein